MPFEIVRNDITCMDADAIVNSTNEFLIPGGTGVDASVHAAAGPELAEALAKIGTCPLGEAVVTDAFGIRQCRYIIHTATPAFKGGHSRERSMLTRCYMSALEAAEERSCTSVALPVLCAGANGYPRREAYRIATRAIRNFLEMTGTSMEIYLVLYGKDMMEQAKAEAPKEFIGDAYPAARRKKLREELKFREELGSLNACGAPGSSFASPQASINYDMMPCMSAPLSAEEDTSDYALQDLSFGEMCEWWAEKKQISKGSFYIQANISKAAFWNLKNHPEANIKKTTALACAVGLRLNYAEAEDLLKRGGLAFSPYMPVDVVVAKNIRKRNWDVFEINMELFDKDLVQLGTKA